MRRTKSLRIANQAFLAASLVAAGPALAGPKCTDEPQSKWLTAEQMTEKFTAMGYKDDIKKVHVSKGNCWEIYGHDKTGKKIEIYFHPVTAVIMEQTVKE